MKKIPGRKLKDIRHRLNRNGNVHGQRFPYRGDYMTQQDLADRLGVARRTVIRWERTETAELYSWDERLQALEILAARAGVAL